MHHTKTIALALVLLHIHWIAAPALAGSFRIPRARETALADLPGMDRLVHMHPGLEEALEHVVSGPGKDIDGSPRVWRIAVLEGARHLEKWNAGPERWLPLFATEYDGRATLFSIIPKPGEKGLFRATWTYADGSPVCDESGLPVPEPQVIVNDEGPDARLLPAVGAVILFCSTFGVECT